MEDLVRSSIKGEVNKVKNILNVYPLIVNQLDQNKCSALQYAVLNNQYECVDILIHSGANVNLQDPSGTTSLMISASKNHIECLKLLLKAGALLEVRNNLGKTALNYADENQNNECAKLLIEAGACLFTGDSSDNIVWMKAKNSYVENQVREAKREWETQKEITDSLKKGIAQYALSNPSLIDIYNHIYRVCSHRKTTVPPIPYPVPQLPSNYITSTTSATQTHLNNAYLSLSLLSAHPHLQSILSRLFDIYAHQEIFQYPANPTHLFRDKEKYNELNNKIFQMILNYETKFEDMRKNNPQDFDDFLSNELKDWSSPHRLLTELPRNELNNYILQRDEVKRVLIFHLKDILVPEKKYQNQLKYDTIDKAMTLMKEWVTHMGYSLEKDNNNNANNNNNNIQKDSTKKIKKQYSSYVSPTLALANNLSSTSTAHLSGTTPSSSSATTTANLPNLHIIPSFDKTYNNQSNNNNNNSSLLITASSMPSSLSLSSFQSSEKDSKLNLENQTKDSINFSTPTSSDVFQSIELLILNLSLWYQTASQSPIDETNRALEKYEHYLEENLKSIRKYSKMKPIQATIPLPKRKQSKLLDDHLTDINLDDDDDNQKNNNNQNKDIKIKNNKQKNSLNKELKSNNFDNDEKENSIDEKNDDNDNDNDDDDDSIDSTTSTSSDPSSILDSLCQAIHNLHTVLDKEESYWTRDPLTSLYPSLYQDIHSVLYSLTALSLDIKRVLLDGFNSLKDKERELSLIVKWIAGSPFYDYSFDKIESEIRELKRDIVRLQREYEDKLHNFERQKRRGYSNNKDNSLKLDKEIKSLEYQLISTQIEYQYKIYQINMMRKELCLLSTQLFPEISLTNSSYHIASSTNNWTSISPPLSIQLSNKSNTLSKTTQLSSITSSNSLTSPYPYPPIFSLPLLLSTHTTSSMHFLQHHTNILSHGILQYNRSLDDFLSLSLVSSSERYLTYRGLDRNQEVYIKKYHITPSSSTSSSVAVAGTSTSSTINNSAVISLNDATLTPFDKLYLEALRLSEMSYSQYHNNITNNNNNNNSNNNNYNESNDNNNNNNNNSMNTTIFPPPYIIDVESLFISSPNSSSTTTIPSLYMVYPSYPNGNLMQFLLSYNSSLSILSRISLMKGVCNALSYLHSSLHILHCNLKLENILITSHYRCVLSDYDISYSNDNQRYNGSVLTPSKGQLDYLPPENLPPYSFPMSISTDIYCFGICLLKVLNKPLGRNHETGLHTVGHYEREDTGNGFKELIEKILSFEPKDRPTTFDILSSNFFTRCFDNIPTGESIDEGSISKRDLEEIEKKKKSLLLSSENYHEHLHSNNNSPEKLRLNNDDQSIITTTTTTTTNNNNNNNNNNNDGNLPITSIKQPSNKTIKEVYIDRQRLCSICGIETDLSQGVSCECENLSLLSHLQTHFICGSCINNYIHSECQEDIAGRRWLKLFDKTTKEEFHVRREADFIIPYFTTKKRCHVEGIDELMTKNPWSDLHEYNHEFDVRNLYENLDNMMIIICPMYNTILDIREKHQRCENILSKEKFLKFLTPDVLYEFEKSSQELLEWKLTWEYNYRVQEERNSVMTKVYKKRDAYLIEKKYKERNIKSIKEEVEEQKGQENQEIEKLNEKNENLIVENVNNNPKSDNNNNNNNHVEEDDDEEEIPEYLFLIGDYIENNIRCIRCPQCNNCVTQGTENKKLKRRKSTLKLLPNELTSTPINLTPPPPPPPPPSHPNPNSINQSQLTISKSNQQSMTTNEILSSTNNNSNINNTSISRPYQSSFHLSNSQSIVLKCSSCSNYFCSLCLSDCGKLGSFYRNKNSLKINNNNNNNNKDDGDFILQSEEYEHRLKSFHGLTCQYNTTGKIWISDDEYVKLQEERYHSMKSDYLQTFPIEIREEYQKFLDSNSISANTTIPNLLLSPESKTIMKHEEKENQKLKEGEI